MSTPRNAHETSHRSTHRISINAPADLVFSVLRDTSHWPYLDGLTVYSERVSDDEATHELRTSVVSNGPLNSSHSWRVFDAAAHRGEFQQLELEPPLLRRTALPPRAAPRPAVAVRGRVSGPVDGKGGLNV